MSGADASSPDAPPPAPSKRPVRICIVATVRDEAPYLLEWLAHHRAMGVTDFLVFSNDCQDGTDTMLDRAAELGLLTHVRNSFTSGASPQRAALDKAMEAEIVAQSDWVLHIDLDEFVHVEVGNGRIPALLRACRPACAISLVSRLYGSSAQRDFEDRPVVERFQNASRILPPSMPNDTEIKTLFRPNLFRRMDIHYPSKPRRNLIRKREKRWRNGSGDDLTDAMLGKPGPPRFGALKPELVGFDLGWVAHFCVKSRAEFLIKRLRGSAEPGSKAQRRYSDVYWNRRDNNTLYLPMKLGPQAASDLAALHEDPVLGELHREAVACWSRWIDERLVTDEAQAFLESGT